MNYSKKGRRFGPKMYGYIEGYFLRVGKEANRIDEKSSVMGHSQYRSARKLVRACCNYDGGNCIALDDGYRGPHEAVWLCEEERLCSEHFLPPAV